MAMTDVALIVGANDVVNPAATRRSDSPIAGMPILDAYKARTVMVIKRSMSRVCRGSTTSCITWTRR
jgi:H+-translocating NAD(P) transhydrogenase subunit beta